MTDVPRDVVSAFDRQPDGGRGDSACSHLREVGHVVRPVAGEVATPVPGGSGSQRTEQVLGGDASRLAARLHTQVSVAPIERSIPEAGLRA